MHVGFLNLRRKGLLVPCGKPPRATPYGPCCDKTKDLRHLLGHQRNSAGISDCLNHSAIGGEFLESHGYPTLKATNASPCPEAAPLLPRGLLRHTHTTRVAALFALVQFARADADVSRRGMARAAAARIAATKPASFSGGPCVILPTSMLISAATMTPPINPPAAPTPAAWP